MAVHSGIVFLLLCSVILFVFCQQSEEKAAIDITIDNAQTEKLPEDHHTFVALIDIAYKNGFKRTCTGTIIHDNVVITTAHCFVSAGTEPELTLTFVVIGTKKMLDSGYEQYLPVERVVTHPNFKGWTADLALVYTYAGMTSDKPGRVIALAGDRITDSLDSNVTLFSWGECKEYTYLKRSTKPIPYTNNDSFESELNPISSVRRVTKGIDWQNHPDHDHVPRRANDKQKLRYQFRSRHDSSPVQRHKHVPDQMQSKHNSKSRYLGPVLPYRPSRKSLQGSYRQKETHNKTNLKLKYKNWRRQMGPQQNKLTVEEFSFVNVQTCKKMIEKTMPKLYEIKDGQGAICYSSEDHYITAEDSGAPAIRDGKLVAVTVGGVECDGDHLALGIRMNCFCSWIAENLPFHNRSTTELTIV